MFGAGLGEISDLDVVLDDAGRLLVITVTTDLSGANQVWLADCPGTDGTLAAYQLAACADGWSWAWPAGNGMLYLLTDDEAPRGRIVAVRAESARTDPGQTLIAENPSAVLESFAILTDEALPNPVLVVAASEAGNVRLSCHDLDTGQPLTEIALPGAGSATDLSCRPGRGHEMWFSYADTLTPPTVYRYDAVSRSVTPWQRAHLAGPRGVVARELRYPSADGTMVRLLVTMPQRASGPLPAIIHAYGAFGESHLAEYYELGLAWAQAGGIFAIACVRGGGEEGEEWHQAGLRPAQAARH